MLKNIASLSLLIIVGAVANTVSASHSPFRSAEEAAHAAMEPVHFFDEKFAVPEATAEAAAPR